jgi:uncharacterized repeat protein (TIGR01451 family)
MGSTVNALLLSGATLYVGGAFTTVNGSTARSRAAGIDTTTGTATSWDPPSYTDGQVKTLALSPNGATLYVGGALYGGLLCVNTTTFAETCGNGLTYRNGAVNAIALSADGVTIYLGGAFTSGGYSQTVGGLAAYGPTPTVQFSASSGSGAESALSPSLARSLSAASDATVTVNYAVTSGTATGSGTDYTLASGTATLNAGETTSTIPFTVADDALDEVDETIVVTLSGPTFATLGATTTHTYTILDNDATPTVQFAAATGSGSESVANPTLTVQLSAASGRTVTADYAVTGGTATGSGTDYTLANGTATIAAGSTSTTVSLTVQNDALDETDETVVVALSNPTNATLGSATVNTYTILDNDATPTVQFAAATGSGSEGTTPVSIGVTLSAASGLAATVNYAVTSGTATGSGTDYTLASGTVTLAAGVTTGSIPMTVVDDAVVESNETLVVTLSNPTNSTLGSSAAFTYTILENDVTPDLAVVTTDGADTTNPDDRLTYTVTATNRGVLSASGATLTGTVPAGTTLVSASDDGTLSGSTVTWPPVTLAGGASAVRTLIVQVDNPVRVGMETLTHTAAVVDDGSQGADPDSTNNAATDTTALDATPVLRVVAKDGQDNFRAGGALTLALVYSNTGDQDAMNVRVGFTVPAHSRLISTTRTWTCSPDRRAGFVCTTAVGNVAAGRSATVRFTLRFNTDLPLATLRTIIQASISEDGGAAGVRTVRIGTREYVAQRGDSLWGIAARAYGRGQDWVHIVNANRRAFPGLAKNPSVIRTGWSLIIPVR